MSSFWDLWSQCMQTSFVRAYQEAGQDVTEAHMLHGEPHFVEVSMAESWKRTHVRRVEGEAEVLCRSASRCVKQARRLTMVADGIRVAREARVE
eukprot:12840820-Alexandrium_andersonii.AAC.1